MNIESNAIHAHSTHHTQAAYASYRFKLHCSCDISMRCALKPTIVNLVEMHRSCHISTRCALKPSIVNLPGT